MEVWGFIRRDIDIVAVFDVFNELFEKAAKEGGRKRNRILGCKLSDPTPS